MKGPDVAFHFNPRFNEQTVVRNSNINGVWGPEERGGGFPFVPGGRFEVHKMDSVAVTSQLTSVLTVFVSSKYVIVTPLIHPQNCVLQV